MCRYYRNKDIFFRKFTNGFSIYIDNNTNKILYTESIIEYKPLGKGNIDLIKDDKISAFDIECYEVKIEYLYLMHVVL